MLVTNAIPSFGGRRKTPDFYQHINAILRVLRPHSTLRTCAIALNQQGFTTATDLPWTRERVSQYLKSNDINSTNE